MFGCGFNSILSTVIAELKENCRFAKQGTDTLRGEGPDGVYGRLLKKKV